MGDKLEYVRTLRGEVCTQGGQILRWRAPDDREVLFVSQQSRLKPGKPIRGGIPIVFPWFGEDPDGKGKAHGIARRRPWSVLDDRTNAATGRVALELRDDAGTRKEWDRAFALRLDAVLGDELQLTVEVENTGESELRFELALHTYFVVGDVQQIAVRGLEGAEYVDRLDGGARKVQPQEPVVFRGESERFFHGNDAVCTIDDPVLGRAIVIEKEGLQSTVLWHPWIDKAKEMSDFGDDEWTGMVCVESGNIADDAVVLAAGATHEMRLRIAVA